MLSYKVKTHIYFHQEKGKKGSPMPSKFLSMSYIYLCAHRLDVGSEKSRNVHRDELRKSASIVQGFFEKQL